MTLEEYILLLLQQGKRSKDVDFQNLFKIYGRDKITRIATKLLHDYKNRSNQSDEDET